MRDCRGRFGRHEGGLLLKSIILHALITLNCLFSVHFWERCCFLLGWTGVLDAGAAKFSSIRSSSSSIMSIDPFSDDLYIIYIWCMLLGRAILHVKQWGGRTSFQTWWQADMYKSSCFSTLKS